MEKREKRERYGDSGGRVVWETGIKNQKVSNTEEMMTIVERGRGKCALLIGGCFQGMGTLILMINGYCVIYH